MKKTLKLRIHIVLIFLALLLIAVGFFAFWLNIAITEPENLTDFRYIIPSIFFLAFFGPPIILTISYFFEDFNKRVILLEDKITVKKNNQEIVINRKDIIDFFHVKVDKYNISRYKFSDFEYISIILKENQRIYITNLLCKPNEIINFFKFKPEIIYTNIPFIDRGLGGINLTTQEFEQKVQEFMVNFGDKTEEDLLKICKQSNVYADYAIKAARQLLNKKSKNTTANKS